MKHYPSSVYDCKTMTFLSKLKKKLSTINTITYNVTIMMTYNFFIDVLRIYNFIIINCLDIIQVLMTHSMI